MGRALDLVCKESGPLVVFAFLSIGVLGNKIITSQHSCTVHRHTRIAQISTFVAPNYPPNTPPKHGNALISPGLKEGGK